ncbi:MAG: hypothetical protein R3E09_01735 [Novosphingobium sp.]
MTPEEIRAYLEEQTRIIVVTNGPDGLPHPAPMNYGLDEEGRILHDHFPQEPESEEHRARSARDPAGRKRRGLFGSQIGHAYTDAEIIDDPEEVAQAMSRYPCRAGNLGQPERIDERAGPRFLCCAWCFASPRSAAVSWDHTKLGDSY